MRRRAWLVRWDDDQVGEVELYYDKEDAEEYAKKCVAHKMAQLVTISKIQIVETVTLKRTGKFARETKN